MIKPDNTDEYTGFDIPNLLDIVIKKIEVYKLHNPMEWIADQWEVIKTQVVRETVILKINGKSRISFRMMPLYLELTIYESIFLRYTYFVNCVDGRINLQGDNTDFGYNHFKTLYNERHHSAFHILVNDLIRFKIITKDLKFNLEGIDGCLTNQK